MCAFTGDQSICTTQDSATVWVTVGPTWQTQCLLLHCRVCIYSLIDNWQVQLVHTGRNLPTWGFGHVIASSGDLFNCIIDDVSTLLWQRNHMLSTICCCLLCCHDVTVGSWQWGHDCLGVIHYCHLVEVGRSFVGGSRGWTSKLRSRSVSIINSLIERKQGCGPDVYIPAFIDQTTMISMQIYWNNTVNTIKHTLLRYEDYIQTHPHSTSD